MPLNTNAAVEDADAAAFGEVAGGSPQEVVLQFGRAGVLEAGHLAALGVDAGHDVLDGAVLAGSVHRLEDQQDGMAVGRVEKLLLVAEPIDVVFEEFAVVGFGFVDFFGFGWPFG